MRNVLQHISEEDVLHLSHVCMWNSKLQTADNFCSLAYRQGEGGKKS